MQFDQLKRRQFITLLGGTAAVWPLAAGAQQAGKLPTIGFLVAGTPSTYNQWVAAFVQRLRELGWIESRTAAIELRWAEGRSERYNEIAAEFVRLKVDAIVTVGTPATLAAKQSTSVIPIVFVLASDPVGTGLVASLSRPGGNVTGLANQQRDLAGKRLELLREIVPDLRGLAIIGNVGNPASVLEMKDAQATARTIGLKVVLVEIRQAEDIAPGFELIKNRADALYGQWLSERLGQQFVIYNRTGGGTNIGTEVVVRAPADGYTLLLCGVFNASNAAFYDKLTFNFIRDIAPVAGVFRGPYVMVVHPSVPARSVPEFIAYAKATPRKINMASSGTGAVPHLAGELFNMMAGIDMVHVPYRGGGPAVTDLLAGQVQ